MNITLDQIARECGVSKSTVSLALRNRGTIGKDTAKKIQDFSKKIGYKRSNLVASSSQEHAGSSKPIILPINTSAVDQVSRHNFYEYFEGISEGAAACHYDVRLVSFRKADKEIEVIERLLARGNISALVNLGLQEGTTRRLLAEGIPMVCVGEDQIKMGVPGVTANVVMGYAQAWQRAREKGHRRAAFIGYENTSSILKCQAGAAMAGTLDCLRSVIYVPEKVSLLELIKQLRDSFGSPATNRDQWPSVLFAQTDHLAFNLINALEMIGLRVPGDTSVIGRNDAPIALEATPPIATLRMPFYQMGLCIANLLVDIIEGRHKNTGLQYNLPVEFVERPSFGPARTD